MARLLCVVVFAPLALVVVQPAGASDYICMGYHRNVCWPRPYIYADRAAVAAPFGVMVNNGWRRNNLLGDHHFEADGTKLTMAGQLKVRWILTQTPQHRRSIYVSQTLEQEQDAARLEAVQVAASKLSTLPTAVDVRPTYLVIEGRAAEMVDSINVRFKDTMPLPILPAASSGFSGEE